MHLITDHLIPLEIKNQKMQPFLQALFGKSEFRPTPGGLQRRTEGPMNPDSMQGKRPLIQEGDF